MKDSTAGYDYSFQRKALLWFFYLFAAIAVLILFLVYPGINEYEAAKFDEMVSGDAYRPFAYRTLIPSTIRLITEITPQPVIDWVQGRTQRSFTGMKLVSLSKIETENIYEYFVGLILFIFCFTGFAFTMRALIRECYKLPDYAADFGGAAALFLIPLLFKYCNYIYDPGTLLFFSLGLLLIVKRNLLLFLPVLILAAINKETSVFLILLIVIREYKFSGLLRASLKALPFFVIWVAVKSSVTYIFRDNPGGLAEFHMFGHNLWLLTDLRSIITVGLIVGAFYFLIKHHWSDKPEFLRRGLLATAIPYALLGMTFGWFDELRMYYEVYIIAYLLALPSVLLIFGVEEDLQEKKPQTSF